MQKIPTQQILAFQQSVLHWYNQYGRKDLPWQKPASPYRVWISEIMLQQTQVDTVIPYFEKFLARFPDILSLAEAEIDEVLHLWSGLGYYARARNLHKSAQILSRQYDASLPDSIEQLILLPGIGKSTAGAIRSLGFNQPAAILDGNVKRVLARNFAISGWPGKSATLNQLWHVSEILTPKQNSNQYNQAMMDIGSLICKGNTPNCGICPLSKSCVAKQENNISSFPGKKPAKKKPHRNQQFYFIQNNQQQVLLYRRPPVGIWGGLWCLPESIELDSIKILTAGAQQITTFNHQFTHFSLKGDIYKIKANNNNQIMDAANWSWYDLSEPAKIGMPAPFISFLQNYTRNS